MHGDFDWEEAKATSNLAKHGISFDEAMLAMKDPFSQDFDDALHPANLSLAIWAYPVHRLHRERPPDPHHQARDATRHERRLYEETE